MDNKVGIISTHLCESGRFINTDQKKINYYYKSPVKSRDGVSDTYNQDDFHDSGIISSIGNYN